MRVLTVTLMLLIIGLAGCAGDEAPEATEPVNDEPVDDADEPADNAEDNTPDTDEQPEETVNETVENLPPTMNLTVDVVNGTAPLLVNFEITADDDSENLTWAFLVDGNETITGAEFPAAFNHTFSEGNWTVTAVVSDGEHTVEETTQIAVAAAIPDPALQELSCGVLLGYGAAGAPTVTISGMPVNLGGCSLGSPGGAWMVVEVNPGASCTINADLDGDGFSDEPATVGKVYESNHAFTAFCYTGAVDVTNTVVFQTNWDA